MSDMQKRFEEEMRAQQEQLKKPNLMIVGGTGVGKSSLLNKVFGKEVAKVGVGKPVTQGLIKIEHDSLPVVFWDTEGYESKGDGEGNSNFDRNVKAKILEMNKKELKDQVHLVWYCISIANHRVTEYDIKTIKWFKENNMKIAVVFTQCDKDAELPNGRGEDATKFAQYIQSEISGIQCFETSTADLPNGSTLDLEKLIEWSIAAIPDEQLRQGFIQGQIASIQAKKDEAYKIVYAAAAGAAAAGGFNPMPGSDALVIAPMQVAMCVKINTIFFGSMSGGAFKSLVSSQVASFVGKLTASSLTKLIPVVGQVINATVAGALTYGIGAAMIELGAKEFEECLKTGRAPNWANIFDSAIFATMANAMATKFKKGDAQNG